jgi:peptidoglycan/LPS O-acetylase OafA/YrhL
MKHGSAIPALALTVALAMTSWRLFESPINDLKRFFPYGGRGQSRLRIAA